MSSSGTKENPYYIWKAHGILPSRRVLILFSMAQYEHFKNIDPPCFSSRIHKPKAIPTINADKLVVGLPQTNFESKTTI